MEQQQLTKYAPPSQDGVTSAVETITPERAADLLKANTHNRQVRVKMVRLYADEMRRGAWRLNGESIKIAKTGVLLDGQHRLEAVVRSGVTIQSLVTRGLDADTFTTIDTGRKRTPGDTLGISGVKSSNSAAAAIRSYATFAARSITSARKSAEDKGMTSEQVLRFYNDNADDVNTAVSVSRGYVIKSYNLVSGSIIAGLYLYLLIDKRHPGGKIVNFINAAFGDTDTDCKSLTELRRRLVRHKTGSRKLAAYYIKAVTAKAWNNYILGRNSIGLSRDEEREDFPEFI